MTKLFILQQIKRTAEANGGKPLGKVEFESRTGITRFDWFGVFWARWSDALREALSGQPSAQIEYRPPRLRSLPPSRTHLSSLSVRQASHR